MAEAMRIPVQFMSGRVCVLEVMPDLTVGELKELLKAVCDRGGILRILLGPRRLESR